jgi:hypothetical protein
MTKPSAKAGLDAARGQARSMNPSALRSSYDDTHNRMSRVPSPPDGVETPNVSAARKTRDAITGDIAGPKSGFKSRAGSSNELLNHGATRR